MVSSSPQSHSPPVPRRRQKRLQSGQYCSARYRVSLGALANGAGKTTLLRALAGGLPVCDGVVELDGQRIDKVPVWTRVREGLAHVPEGRHVFGSMTVKENLQVGGLAVPEPASIEQMWELFPRLLERRDQFAGTLSGGEQQQLVVVVARALMTGPKVLLIDEMSAGLAPVMVERLVDGLAAIREQGVTVVLVEQAPHMVAAIVDRAYLLVQGRIVGNGTLDELGGNDALARVYLGV
ncbi:MAG: ABC transporter ATP-binding protein [Geodermatophilaceae bacterium]